MNPTMQDQSVVKSEPVMKVEEKIIQPQIYKATYSGIPVYEMSCKDISVMKRQTDNYVNATQILKVAEFDKPQRTRILEREVQIGEHEKIQGGYGKYQGTWIPFERGMALARHYKVDNLLKPIFEYVKGDKSPPLAPKHHHTVSARLKKPREKKKNIPRKIGNARLLPAFSDLSHYPQEMHPMNMVDPIPYQQQPPSQSHQPLSSQVIQPPLPSIQQQQQYYSVQNPSLLLYNDVNHNETKRQRLYQEEDIQTELYPMLDIPGHTYAEKLLHYFISNDTGIPDILLSPPVDLDVNVIIDDEGHTSLHWAAAMGRLKLVKLLIDLGADIFRVNYKGQTALMRSVLFTNNFDSKCFLFLIEMLKKTIFNIDKKDQTVFHHVATTASWKGKVHASRYYMECLISTLNDTPSEMVSLLNVQDVNGDTSLIIASRIGNKKLIKLLRDAGADTNIRNEDGVSAQDYISEMEKNKYPPMMTPSVHSMCHPQNEVHRMKLRKKVESLCRDIMVNDKMQSNVIPSMYEGFIANYDKELEQRESLMKERKSELRIAQKRLIGLQHTSEQIEMDPVQLTRVEEECERLGERVKKLMWLIQRETLELYMKKHECIDRDAGTVEMKKEIEDLKKTLLQLKQSRNHKIDHIIQLKLQTPSMKHQQYKRLISMCCNVSYENVDLMLIPLLSSFDELAQ